jgi:hypothetical protein
MDNNYEPSFEVVDKAEDAEDYLLAKNRRVNEPTQSSQKVDSPTLNNTSTNNKTETTDKEKMNFNGLTFLSGTTSESKDVDGGKVESDGSDPVLQCVTEEEEGQEALWLEEAESSPSASSASASPALKKSSTRRSSFLFGSGGGSSSKAADAPKKVDAISPRRTISFRKKTKNPPKIMLLDGASDAKMSQTPAVSSTLENVTGVTNSEAAPVAGTVVSERGGVIKSDTVSSLGFDKSFDVKSPLSMSSLNEILDAPPTPSGTTEESMVAEPTKKRTKKGAVRGILFRKKEKKDKEKKSFAFMNRTRYARSVVVVEKEEKEDDADDADPVLFVTRDINERIQASLMRAMENDDAESLTSFTGVPMILKEDKNCKSNDKPKSVTVIQGQKPLNFEKVKPTFVVSKDSLTLAEIQEKFVPMYDDEEEEEEEEEDKDVQNLASPVTSDVSNNEGELVEALKSSSPSSTGVDSAITDRYEVARNACDDNDSDYDDNKSDKYAVLPDPCSFCESFWVTTDNQAAVSNTMSESPDMKAEPSKYDFESSLDAPAIDKYSELPEVVANKNDDVDGQESNIPTESSFNKSTTAVASNRTLSNLFGKLKRSTSSPEIPETSVANNCATTDRDVEPITSSDPEEPFAPETTNDEPKLETDDHVPTETNVVVSKSSTSLFFGKFRKSSASKSKTNEAVATTPELPIAELPANTPTVEEISETVVQQSKTVSRKSILKKRKEVMMIPVDEPTSYIVPGNDLESPGAKISVLSLGSEPHYMIPPAATSATDTSKSTTSGNMTEQHPVTEDPSTEGSSSAEDEVANAKIVSIAPVSPTKSTITTTDPLLSRLRKNLHKRRGLEPQTDVDPIITVGNGRTQLEP